MVLLKLALRNLFAHKVKSLIVGSLIFFGILMIVLGNSFLDSAQRGIQNAYSRSVTGQIAVLKRIDFDYSLFGTWADVGNLRVPRIPDYEETENYLMNHPDVKSLTPVCSGFAGLALPEQETDEWLVTFGIDPESYERMFDLEDALDLQEGRFLEAGEEGIVLSRQVVDNLEKYKGKLVRAGDKIVLSGWSANGARIREVPVVGIYRYRYLQNDLMPMLERTSFLDIQTYRILNGLTVSILEKEDEPLFDETLLLEDNFEDLFSDTIEISVAGDESEDLSLEAILGDLEVRHRASQTDTGAWQWFLIRTHNERDKAVARVIEDMEEHFLKDFENFDPEDILKPGNFLSQLNRMDKEFFGALRSLFDPAVLRTMEQYEAGLMDEAAFRSRLAVELTRIIKGPSLYDESVFEELYLDTMTRNLAEDNPKAGDLIRLNRLILEDVFSSELAKGPDYMISEWWHAAAPMSMITQGIKGVLNIALIIIFAVSTIIIMNTLVISVMERTAEIGTIRALGGQKGFIFRLFVLESLTISAFFGGLGILMGALLIQVIQLLGIPAPPDSFMRTLINADTLYPTLSPRTVVYSFIFIGIIGLVSSLYPVNFALQVDPIKAIQSE